MFIKRAAQLKQNEKEFVSIKRVKDYFEKNN